MRRPGYQAKGASTEALGIKKAGRAARGEHRTLWLQYHLGRKAEPPNEATASAPRGLVTRNSGTSQVPVKKPGLRRRTARTVELQRNSGGTPAKKKHNGDPDVCPCIRRVAGPATAHRASEAGNGGPNLSCTPCSGTGRKGQSGASVTCCGGCFAEADRKLELAKRGKCGEDPCRLQLSTVSGARPRGWRARLDKD
ncbi:hypothetical protein NDU88_003620 [Pleurodeles waltl]|uniref:Uncharacterized protein n=1 Tax=Pleurodeles waltl TaxID=8319 RepID=A0AAV7VDT9_PLEWA|nr:hypothetical protein NDU88_003620 [Pleurodeles waltl]